MKLDLRRFNFQRNFGEKYVRFFVHSMPSKHWKEGYKNKRKILSRFYFFLHTRYKIYLLHTLCNNISTVYPHQMLSFSKRFLYSTRSLPSYCPLYNIDHILTILLVINMAWLDAGSIQFSWSSHILLYFIINTFRNFAS